MPLAACTCTGKVLEPDRAAELDGEFERRTYIATYSTTHAAPSIGSIWDLICTSLCLPVAACQRHSANFDSQPPKTLSSKNTVSRNRSMKRFVCHLVYLLLLTTSLGSFAVLPAQWEGREKILEEKAKLFGDPRGMIRLDPDDHVWVDRAKKRVVVDGYITMREGALEMFACPVGTKEHESIVATFCKAQTVHAGLLAVGAEAGKPVQWQPTYVPPSGSEIQITALWYKAGGEQAHIDVRKWLRVMGTEDDILEPNFVFAGSMFWEDPDTGLKHYQAESGDLICVSNFSTATLDVPLKSTHANTGLMFVAFTDRIPAKHTPVRLVLQVVPENKAPATPAPADAKPAEATKVIPEKSSQ